MEQNRTIETTSGDEQFPRSQQWAWSQPHIPAPERPKTPTQLRGTFVASSVVLEWLEANAREDWVTRADVHAGLLNVMSKNTIDRWVKDFTDRGWVQTGYRGRTMSVLWVRPKLPQWPDASQGVQE